MDRLTTLFRGLAPFRPSTNPIHRCSAITRRSPQSIIRSQRQPFSTTQVLQKRKKGQKKDYRITNIRYHLKHPLTPRPLRFSRSRYLRHWTIHRAWQLYQANLRKSQEIQLERQYNSMREACELLRTIGRDGMVGGENEGRLFRRAMEKRGIWSLDGGERVGVPIEYARLQTEWPSSLGWNHEWRRG